MSADMVGQRLSEVAALLPPGVRILVVRHGDENRHPTPDLVVASGAVLLLAGDDTAALESARRRLGEHASGRVVGDRSHLDLLYAFVSRPLLAGLPVSKLAWPEGVDATVTHVQRGDAALIVTPELTLELGDRVGLLDRSPGICGACADSSAIRSAARRSSATSLSGSAW